MTDAAHPTGQRCRFDDEVVLVTGAGQGLGRAYALAFAARGAHVAVLDVDQGALTETVDLIGSSGGSAFGVVADVTQPDEAVAEVRERHGRIDVVVNNAGIVLNAPFPETTVADVGRLLQVHAIGTFAVTAAAWPDLVTTGGRVVNVTSGALFGLPGHTAYAMAKGAILGLTRALASETDQVKVNAVMPMARTRMYEEAGGRTGSSEDELMTRHFPPEAVSPTVVYLGWSGVACHGQVLEVAGAATSKVALATGPNVIVRSPEDLADLWSEISVPELTEVTSIADSVVTKLGVAASAEAEPGMSA